MLYTINELKRELYPRVYKTFDIIEHHFGEEYTDIEFLSEEMLNAIVTVNSEGKYNIEDSELHEVRQNLSLNIAKIHVWWPEVRVTNENDRYVDIKDLYAEITIDTEGCIPYEQRGFTLARATFTRKQFRSGYIHSHISPSNISKYSTSNSKFGNPCLGSGPIQATILSLKNEWSEIEWMLFCQELSLYVTVESLHGGPYIRLENISSKKYLSACNDYTTVNLSLEEMYSWSLWKDFIHDFIIYYAKHNHLTLKYIYSSFDIGNSYYEYMLDISNAFITWFNQSKYATKENSVELYDYNIINTFMVENGKFYYEGRDGTNIQGAQGNKLLTFKGKDILISIEDSEENACYTTILNHEIAMVILSRFINILNYHYGDTKQTSGSQEGTSSIDKAVCYLSA